MKLDEGPVNDFKMRTSGGTEAAILAQPDQGRSSEVKICSEDLANGETGAGKVAGQDQGRSLKKEIVSGDDLTARLDKASRVGSKSAEQEATENGCGAHCLVSCGGHEVLDEDQALHIGTLEEGGKEKAGQDDTFTAVEERRDNSVASSANCGQGERLQQYPVEIEKVDKLDVAHGALKVWYNEKEDPHLDNTVESNIAYEGDERSKGHDFMEMDGDIALSSIVHVDQEHQLSVAEVKPEVEMLVNGLESKEAEQKQLSKSALKQIVKQERYKEIKRQRKAAEKDKRHQETARKRREWEDKLSCLSDGEKERMKLEKLSARKERKEEQNARKEKLRQALERGQNLVIDLEFCDLMKPNEITSLIQQVMYSYAANGKAAVPGRISLTGVRGDVQNELKKISGFSNWLVHKEERSYVEVFEGRQSDLVYLTADSENMLESLDSTKIYIIGGLVDRNRWKNITLEKANKQGIATAKLPIGDHLKMMSSQVLTVNQVVELLLCFLDGGDWKKALMQVVPLRKRAAEDSFDGSGKQQEAERLESGVARYL